MLIITNIFGSKLIFRLTGRKARWPIVVTLRPSVRPSISVSQKLLGGFLSILQGLFLGHTGAENGTKMDFSHLLPNFSKSVQ